MPPSPFSAAAFQLHRVVRAQPSLCGAVGIASVLFFASAIALLQVRQSTVDAVALEAVLRQDAKSALKQPVANASPVAVSLQPFNSAQLVQALNEVAAQVGVSLDEVSFNLDESAGQPFLRYRASFQLSSNYLTVRRFIDSVHSELRDTSLDSISCTRESIEAPLLKCDLVFSAFYAKLDV